MMRHLLAAVLVGTLVLAPSAAFAQEDTGSDTTTDAPSSWEALGEVVGQLLDALTDGREVAGDSDDSEALDTLVGQIEGVLTDLVAGIYFDAVADAATAEATTTEGDEVDGANGEAVSTLARCAPRGSFKALIDGMANHGEYVTAAAHGETVTLNVPTVTLTEDGGGITHELGEATAEDFDLTTVEGAEDLCAALDVVYQARLLELEVAWEDVDTHRDARVLVREQCQLERLREKNGAEDTDAKATCAELRQRVKDLHGQERADAKAEREEARAEAKADRDAARAEREAARSERAGASGRR